MAATVVDVVAHFNWTGPIGCALPTVVQQGVVRTAANISRTWIDGPERSFDPRGVKAVEAEVAFPCA